MAEIEHAAPKHSPHERGYILLRLIGLFKLVKALTLILMGFVVLHLIRRDTNIAGIIDKVAHHLHVDPGNRYLKSLLEKSLSITRRKLELAASVLFFYATIFAIEGLGLILKKHWAEWMTVITTVGLIPFEVYEIHEKVGPFKIIALIINVAIAIYLAIRAWRETHPKAAV
jgi:uncharacterized membrane protein (DUF2068 family)